MAATWFPSTKERYTPEKADEKLKEGFDIGFHINRFDEPDITKLKTPVTLQTVTEKEKVIGWIIHRDYSKEN